MGTKEAWKISPLSSNSKEIERIIILHTSAIIFSELIFQKYKFGEESGPTLRVESGWGKAEIDAVSEVVKIKCFRGILGGIIAGSMGGSPGMILGGIGGAVAAC